MDGAKIRMVASDIDGTLLRGDATLSPRTISVLGQAAASGVTIVLATGRTRATMAGVLAQLPMVRYVIWANGAAIWDVKEGRQIGENPIPHALFAPILDILCSEDVCWHCFANGVGYVDRGLGGKLQAFFQGLDGAGRDFSRDIRHIDHAREYILEKVDAAEKFGVITGNREARRRVWGRLEQLPELAISSASWYNLEINMKTATKGGALAMLAGQLGIRQEEIIAFGDNLNDCSLLQAAGMGVAMGNADPQLLSIAGYQADTNQRDGLARFLAGALRLPLSEEDIDDSN